MADTATYHAARAARIGNAGINGDDPNKIIKLRRKLAQAQHLQEQMKAAKQVIKRKRKGYTDEQKLADLATMGYSPTAAAKLLPGVGFAPYQLSNNSDDFYTAFPHPRVAWQHVETQAYRFAALTGGRAIYTIFTDQAGDPRVVYSLGHACWQVKPI